MVNLILKRSVRAVENPHIFVIMRVSQANTVGMNQLKCGMQGIKPSIPHPGLAQIARKSGQFLYNNYLHNIEMCYNSYKF